jgi:DNA adenine methylase
VLRDRPDELATRAALTPHSRAEYRACSVWIRDPNREPVDDLETARRVWVCLNQGRAGVLRASGWRHYVNPAGSSSSMPDYLAGYVGRMCPAAERLAGVTLESVAALDLIVKYGREPAALLYVDPPYLGSTRPGTYGKDAYRHELKTEAEHRELAEALRGARAAVVLSGYPSPLYDEQLYPDWHRVTFPASTGQGGTWENRTEVLWSNRPLDTARQRSLFDSEDVS